jgi:esterase/lipase superfamily enzyme
MADPDLFMATNRRKELHSVPTGDINHPVYSAWTFGNEIVPDGTNHAILVTRSLEVQGYAYYDWVEYSSTTTFFDIFFDALQGSRRSITLYLHGYNNDFKDAVKGFWGLRDSAEEQDYPGAMLAYDWCSAGAPHLYGKDRRNVEASAGHALDFIRALRQACDAKGGALNIACHSMGNYLISLVAERWLGQSGAQEEPCIDRLIMLAPDVDNGIFDLDASGSPADPRGRGILAMSRETRVLYCPEDAVLFACEHIEQPDRPRLGRTGPASSDLPPGLNAVNMARHGVKDHGGYFEGRALKYWLKSLKSS